METNGMSQRTAAEHAWKAAERAEAGANGASFSTAEMWSSVSRAWASVASQFVFVHDDALPGPDPAGGAPTNVEDARVIEETLRINPMTENLSETVVLPRTVDPASTHPVMCACSGWAHHPLGSVGCVSG